MNEKTGIQDLVVLLAEKTNIAKKDAETLIKECFDLMGESLEKDKLLKIKNLGTFKLIRVEDRESIDVSTGERVIIPAHYKVSFSPDTMLAEKVEASKTFLENVETETNDVPVIKEEIFEEESEENENEEKNIYVKEKAKITPKYVEDKPERAFENREKEEDFNDFGEFEEEYDENYEPIGNKKKLLWLLFFIAAFIILFFTGQYFYPKLRWKKVPDMINVVSYSIDKSTVPDSLIVADSAKLQTIDSTKKQTPDTIAAKEKTPAPPAQPVAKTQIAEIQSKKLSDNKMHTIREGERLNIIALREYGHKAFWVYIYEENQNKISNPDVVNPGMVIQIPPASKYGIDKNDPESVKKALDLEQKYKQ